jgi:hypothetical protein
VGLISAARRVNQPDSAGLIGTVERTESHGAESRDGRFGSARPTVGSRGGAVGVDDAREAFLLEPAARNHRQSEGLFRLRAVGSPRQCGRIIAKMRKSENAKGRECEVGDRWRLAGFVSLRPQAIVLLRC